MRARSAAATAAWGLPEAAASSAAAREPASRASLALPRSLAAVGP